MSESNTAHRRYRFGYHGQGWFWNQASRSNQAVRRRSRQIPKTFNKLEAIRLPPVIHQDNLLANLEALERERGTAPGPDGIRLKDIGRQDQCAMMRDLRRVVEQGVYHPGPARMVTVPKPCGGTRMIQVRNSPDRVLSKAVTSAVTPALDPLFLDCSYGFRAGESHWHLLADFAAWMEVLDYWVVAEDDVKQAFDFVPIEAAASLYAQYIPDARMVTLIETILRGHEPTPDGIGIAQGCSLSPVTLNFLLDHVLDRPIRSAVPHIPFLRFADNLVACCRDMSQGRDFLTRAQHLMSQQGFTLKGVHQGKEPVNLRRQGARVGLLGFQLHKEQTQVGFSLGKDTWKNLSQAFQAVLETENPTQTVKEICLGWINACGPACENASCSSILEKLQRTATRAGFRDIGNLYTLSRLLRKSHDNWVSLRHQARYRIQESVLLSMDTPLECDCESSRRHPPTSV